METLLEQVEGSTDLLKLKIEELESKLTKEKTTREGIYVT